MKKSILTIVLLAAMLLTACSQTSDGGNEDTTVIGNDVETATLETTAAPEYVVPETDYSGREFTFSSWTSPNPAWIASSYLECGVEGLNGDIINDAIYERNATIKDVLGVTIIPKKYTSESEMLTTMFAGDFFADTVLIFGGRLEKVLNQDFAYDLFSIPTLDLDKSWWDQNAIEESVLGDKLFFASGSIGSFGQMGIFVTYFNKSMIEQFQLESPYDLVRNGSWTFDKMAEMSEVVSADLDGDGAMTKDDRFGMSSESGVERYLLFAGGARITEMDSSGVPQFALNTERAAGIIEKIIPMYRNKETTLYSADYASGYSNVFSQLIVPTFTSDRLMFLSQWLCVSLELRNMESDFGIIPFAKYDEAQDEYYAGSSNSWSQFAVVPITTPDIEFTGDIMNALGYYGDVYVNTALMETTITSKTLRDTDTEEMLNLIYASRCYDPALYFNWGDISATLAEFISDNTTDFASKVFAVEDKVNAAIAETMEKYLG